MASSEVHAWGPGSRQGLATVVTRISFRKAARKNRRIVAEAVRASTAQPFPVMAQNMAGKNRPHRRLGSRPMEFVPLARVRRAPATRVGRPGTRSAAVPTRFRKGAEQPAAGVHLPPRRR
ncbi:hypothetical protein BU14_0357s0004 [Porphyra umbilicalis]|uniref:Uncharacterized protein n=1 Tax=Porphyra umbilicalis TaxID=2786 RepID=A0A1X6NXG5_PORUM|nr:hypothetical protein BU14_0357s0004 [Porphyra umbilicalis]|eukprot:OSX73311.1 hypothetical protein BU14_0357s0004 [Porphyra umbilicalis]